MSHSRTEPAIKGRRLHRKTRRAFHQRQRRAVRQEIMAALAEAKEVTA